MHRRGCLWIVILLAGALVVGPGQTVRAGSRGAAPVRAMPSNRVPHQPEAGTASLVGQWVGHLDLGAGERFAELTIRAERADHHGEMKIWGREEAVVMRDIHAKDDGHISLELLLDGRNQNLEAVLEENVLSGTLIQASQRADVQLLRVIDLDLDDYRPYIGSYTPVMGEPWFVGSADLAGRFYLAEGDRQMRLLPIAPDVFYTSTGETVTFTRDLSGAVGGLARLGSNDHQEVATRIERYTTHPIHIANGATTLAGELIMPPGSGPFPTVVFTHGSGPETRERRRLLADRFAQHDIAAVIYDKRGTGESTGDWYRASFDDLAADALAVVDVVADQPRINSGAIGLWGLSQGGWVVPLAASRSDQVAFAITASASGVSPSVQELYRWHNLLRDLGYTGPTLDAALKAVRLQQDLNAADVPGVDDLFLGLDFGYDPVPALAHLAQPILAIWGAEDRVVPPHTSAVIFQETLRSRQHTDTTLKVFEGAGHSLGLTPTEDGWISLPPAYLTTMTEWIQARTLPQPELGQAGLSENLAAWPDPQDEVIPVPALPWYGRAPVQLTAIAILSVACLVIALGWPVQHLVRGLRRRQDPPLQESWTLRLGTSLVGTLGLYLLVGFTITLGQFLLADDGALLRYSTGPVVRILSWLVSLAAPALGILTWLARRRGLASRPARVLGAIAAGAGLVLALFLRYWQLLRL
ncbi:MAG: alpha/beta fold hydrolase [Anaerolineae bacterium]|nr:alpha/beta fold hydrolase [Anaerolineae bacterium]